MENHFDTIASVMQNTHGMDISVFDSTFLYKTLEAHIRQKGTTDYLDYCRLLEGDKAEAVALFTALHVNYSEFFRNPLTFAVLEKLVFPSLLMRMKRSKDKNRLRLWSAACAGGHEVYSIAILLQEISRLQEYPVAYQIFATDKNQASVNYAREAYYHPAEIGKLSLNQLNKWFIQHKGAYEVKPELKLNTEFTVFDLLSETYAYPQESIFGDFDIVLLANLLFYYEEKQQRQILKKISGALAPQAYLVSGEAERQILLQNGFTEVFPHSCIFIQNTKLCYDAI